MAKDTAQEIWLPIAENPKYQVSNLGRVRSDRRRGSSGGLIRLRYNKHGYPEFKMSTNGKTRTTLVHTVVCEAFHGPRPDGMVTRHLDGNPANGCAENLAWGTYADNGRDMVRHGTARNGFDPDMCWGDPRSHNTSGYRGVWFHKPGKWRASIQVDKKANYLGMFPTPELAHQAYLKAAEKFYGDRRCA